MVAFPSGPDAMDLVDPEDRSVRPGQGPEPFLLHTQG